MSDLLSQSSPTYPELLAERDALRAQLNRIQPGHFYSPIPALEEVHQDAPRIFDFSLRDLPGIDLNVTGQLELLAQIEPFYPEQPFSDEAAPGLRYYFRNGFFGYADAVFLFCLMRWARPRRIIEVGSGFTSFVMLDTNERFFDNQIRFTFIEPYDERLRSRLTERDLAVTEIIARRVQDVELTRFDELQANDILFIDSSHVSKVGSDVNRILFEILPRLTPGVLVHFHDVFYPFEYPRSWIEDGRAWNEDYLLRAFLQFNSAFKIRIWDQFLAMFHADRLKETMPLCLKNPGGSLWLQRV